MFTPEELEEMRRADEEIEATFCLTMDDIRESRRRDRAVKLDRLDNQGRKAAAYQKAYREANREKLAASQKAYREANREKLAASQKAYREANREKVAASQKAYYEANREKLAASQKALLERHLASLGITQKQFAEVLGVSPGLISQWGTGKVPINVSIVRRKYPAFADIVEATFQQKGDPYGKNQT